MKIPFTIEQFFRVFESYNTAIWPAQIVAYALGVIAILAAVRGGKTQSRIISAILASFWIWMGAVYHIMHFVAINPAARLFGVLFVIQGILLVITGCVVGRLRFQFTARPIPVVGAFIIVYAMVIYPLLGAAFGHHYPTAPMFGVAPCPATIFTFGILLWASTPLPAYVVIIPLLWSLIGVTAAINLQVPQDYGLGLAGVLGTILILINNRGQIDRKRNG